MGLDKKRIKDVFLLVLMIAAVFCYVSCGSSSDDDDDDDDDDAKTALTVSGVAAKGLVNGGVVNIHPIINGVLSTSPTQSGQTDENGAYSITINDYDGNPFVVRITTTAETTMRCDLAGGCGDGVDFGADISLDDTDFSLDAVVPTITDPTTNVNLTTLTNVAAGVALSALDSGTATDITQAINNANTAVANRFGLTGNVTNLPVVDITNPASLATADQSAIQYNLYNASLVESIMSENNLSSIGTAVNEFTQQWLSQGGIADTAAPGSIGVTLADVLSSANQVISEIENRDTGNTLNLDQLQNTINQNQQQAQNGSTTPTGGTPQVPTGSSGGTIDG